MYMRIVYLIFFSYFAFAVVVVQSPSRPQWWADTVQSRSALCPSAGVVYYSYFPFHPALDVTGVRSDRLLTTGRNFCRSFFTLLQRKKYTCIRFRGKKNNERMKNWTYLSYTYIPKTLFAYSII